MAISKQWLFFERNLVSALLDGTWTARAMRARARQACLENSRWLAQLVRKISAQFGAQPPEFGTLLTFLQSLNARDYLEPQVGRLFLRPTTMTPRWPVPVLATGGQLADWFRLSVSELDWFADLKGWTLRQNAPKLRHYRQRLVPRRGNKPRLLEIPKPRLKAIQRRILHEILDQIPPHSAAHAFRAQRSILSYAQPHAGQRMVLRFDLRDFFASISAARVRAIFQIAGYPPEVARILAGLCTTIAPAELTPATPYWRSPHLPQGAPTSPALANLAAYRLDVRLTVLAQALGATYTRYADDLAFSGDRRLERAARRVQVLVAVIAAEEGFELHLRKSRFMRQGLRQQLAGVVVNARPNVRRDVYDELKATLHNCVRHGPASQNRAGHADFRRHLLGRIAHVNLLNPARGAKLRAMFDRICWPSAEIAP